MGFLELLALAPVLHLAPNWSILKKKYGLFMEMGHVVIPFLNMIPWLDTIFLAFPLLEMTLVGVRSIVIKLLSLKVIVVVCLTLLNITTLPRDLVVKDY